MDSGMGTSAQTETFYGSGQVEVEGPEAHQGGGRQGGGGDGHPAAGLLLLRGAKKKFNWGPKNERVATAFWFFWLFGRPPIKGRRISQLSDMFLFVAMHT
jgi:hypothetical protein